MEIKSHVVATFNGVKMDYTNVLGGGENGTMEEIV